CRGLTAKRLNHAHHYQPACGGYQKLQDADSSHLENVPHQLQLQADVFAKNVQVRAALAEHVKLKHDANASSYAGGNRGPGNAEPGKWSKAPDQAGIEAQVDEVRQPENAHGNSCVSGAAKDRIDEKKQKDDAGTAQHDSRVKRPDAQNPWTGTHP